MTIQQAIEKIESNMRECIKNNQLCEYEMWKKYREQLEIIGIVLEEIET